MTSLAEKAAANKQALNPASDSSPAATRAERVRVPMTVPVQKLAAPEIPGFFLYWMRGTPDRLQQANRAGFEFVTEEEMQVNNTSLGGDASKSGSTDLGSRVSVLANTSGDGEIDGSGQPVRLYLMKQKWEWHLEDQKLLEDQNQGIANALTSAFRSGAPLQGAADGERPDDVTQRYVDPRRTRIPDLFKPKRGR